MTRRKALADRLVALRIIEMHRMAGLYFPPGQECAISAERVVHDGRVVLAAMERVRELGWTLGYAVVGKSEVEAEVCRYNVRMREHDVLGCHVAESLAIAVLNACCDALEQAND